MTREKWVAIDIARRKQEISFPKKLNGEFNYPKVINDNQSVLLEVQTR